jgi:hypothetical protein
MEKCEHNNFKILCGLCKKSNVIIIKDKKTIQRENGLCIHNRQKSHCKECGGSAFCKHNRQERNCKDCKGNGICEHNRQKAQCKECKGTSICKHNKRKTQCKECNGVSICKHNKRKIFCKECDGSRLCKIKMCETQSIKKYDGYCARCFIYNFATNLENHNYLLKEIVITKFIISNFCQYDWQLNKKIKNGKSKRRPDILLDLGYQILIIEIDERQHLNYKNDKNNCYIKRILEILIDLYNRPIIFIRFNPDDYLDKNYKKINSCWTFDNNNLYCINKKYEKEWNDRLNNLKIQIEYWCNPINKSTKNIHIINMYFNYYFENSDFSKYKTLNDLENELMNQYTNNKKELIEESFNDCNKEIKKFDLSDDIDN